MAKIERPSGPGRLAGVLDRLLEQGVVADAWARITLAGFELLSVEGRVAISSAQCSLSDPDSVALTYSAGPRAG